MSVTTAEGFDETFGKVLKVSNGSVDLEVTLEVGPRVISCNASGMENMFYQDKKKTSLGEKQACYGGDIIKLYGGHRVWISPEVMPRCYYPDNKEVSYSVDGNAITFTAPMEEINHIQKSIRLTLEDDEPKVYVENMIKNCGVWDITFAPWSITMLDKGGKEIIPQPNRQTGYLHNRSVVLWPYSNMNDSRVYWGEKYITLTQNAAMENPFKLGINNEAGWACYFNKGQVFYKLFEPKINGNYPDDGCCFESYTNSVMCECECLGEFVTLKPEESVKLAERWEIYKEDRVPSNDEAEISEIIGKHIK